MIGSKFSKVLGMSGAELRIRLRERCDTVVERLTTVRGAGWPSPRVTGSSSDVRELQQRLAAGDRSTAGRLIARHLDQSPPRFLVHSSSRAALVQQIHATFPHAAAHAAARADRVCSGTFDLLGYTGLRFGSDPAGPDWHLDPVSGRRAPTHFWTSVPYLDPAVGDHKVIWELNRHQHWLVLGRAAWLNGRPKDKDQFVSELRSWLAASPPYRGINWASMLELAFRSLSWIWALHLFADEQDPDAAWIVDLLGGLEAQLDHIARHLSWYFSPNTHLLGEGLALYIAGRTLPILARAEAWDSLGRRVLLQERTHQVHADGGHAEGSLHYHRYALDFYLLALAVARQTGDIAAEAFEETARRMARYARAMADDAGRLMTIGDDDGGQLFPMCGSAPWDVAPSLSVAAALLDDPGLAIGPAREESLWIAGRTQAAAAASVPSIHFPDSGYSVLRDQRVHAILDTGRHGFLNGGHAHADALALTASLDGSPLLIDPGTATYTMDPEVRDRFRSTALHNTLTLGGRDQSIPRGPFHWSTRTDARSVRWITGAGVDYAEGEHLAYDPVQHRRAVLRAPGILLVADHLHGHGLHSVALSWNVHPDWTPTAEETFTRLDHTDGPTVTLATTAGPLTEVRTAPGGAGWIAPVYGQMLPGLTLRAGNTLVVPATVITALAWDPRGMRVCRPLDAASDEETGAGVLIEDDGGTTIGLFVRRTDAVHQRSLTRVISSSHGVLVTDARAALLRLARDGSPESLILVEGSEASWTGAHTFAFKRPMAELLHLDSTVLRQLSRQDEPRSVI